MSPIGKDGIVVDVTLANGDGTIAGMAIKPVADSLSMNAEWIERFSTDIKKVVGKKISEIESLGGVSGSTLTYQGFMIAVENIRAQASSPR
ncbi:MAG: FMN-binding protein [Patescibacteria group bacterium]